MNNLPQEEIGIFNGKAYTADTPRIPCTIPDCDYHIPHHIAGYPGELAEAMQTHDPDRCPCSACYVRRRGQTPGHGPDKTRRGDGMRNTKDMIDDKVVKMIDTLYKLFKKAVLDALREHFAEVTSEKNAKALQKKLNDNAPHKYYTINFDQVITHAIAEGGPAYELMIANDPIAEYLPKDERIVLRHPKDPDRIGVVAYTFCPVNYRSNGVVRFLNSNQTETTNEGQRAQLARLNR